MLAWLLRGGWVTQLCTFAYVVVWPEILYEVEYEMEAEELAAAAEESRSKNGDKASPLRPAATPSAPNMPETSQDDPPSSSQPVVPENHETLVGAGDEPSPKTRLPPPRSSNTPEPAPTSTAQHVAEMARLERIAMKAHREAADKATAHARKVTPIATSHPAVNDSAHLAGLTPHIILDAKKATGKESRYLSAIARRFKDDKVKGAWQVMCKYLDGRCALERVALQEDMKRKEAWTLLTAMSEYVLCTRHW
jgi:hypothetical protein